LKELFSNIPYQPSIDLKHKYISPYNGGINLIYLNKIYLNRIYLNKTDDAILFE